MIRPPPAPFALAAAAGERLDVLVQHVVEAGELRQDREDLAVRRRVAARLQRRAEFVARHPHVEQVVVLRFEELVEDLLKLLLVLALLLVALVERSAHLGDLTEHIASAAVLCRAARLAERLLLIPQLARLEVAFARALRQVLFTREQALAL